MVLLHQLSFFASLIFALSMREVMVKAHTVDETCTVSSGTEVSLGIDPRNAFAVEVLADVYVPDCGEEDDPPERESKKPLVVFAPGGGVSKDRMTLFATGIAKRGYVVMILQHPVVFGPPGTPAENFVTAVDISSAIDYAEENQSDLKIDMSRIVLIGHSWGGLVVFDALNEACFPPFCAESVPLPLHPGVKVATNFAASLVDPNTNLLVDSSNNNGFSIFLAIGDGDQSAFSTDLNGEDIGQGTFDRLEPTKVMAVIEDLDHYSIVDDSDGIESRADVPSTLPRREQVQTVVETLSLWIEKELTEDKTNRNFCSDLTQTLGSLVRSCDEEYDDEEQTPSNSRTKYSLLPVVLNVLLLLLAEWWVMV